MLLKVVLNTSPDLDARKDVLEVANGGIVFFRDRVLAFVTFYFEIQHICENVPL